MNDGLAVQTPESHLLSEWNRALDLEVSAGEISTTSRTTYENGMKRFISWLASSGYEKVSPEAIKAWKAALLEKGIKPSSVNTWLAGVRRFFNWARAEGLIAVNPTQGVKGAKRRNTKKTHLRSALSDSEVLRVLAQPDRTEKLGKRDYCLLTLKAYCGLRDVELHRADIVDINTDGATPVLYVYY